MANQVHAKEFKQIQRSYGRKISALSASPLDFQEEQMVSGHMSWEKKTNKQNSNYTLKSFTRKLKLAKGSFHISDI